VAAQDEMHLQVWPPKEASQDLTPVPQLLTQVVPETPGAPLSQ